MRLALIATVALLPTAAFAQAGSQTLQAGLAQPVAFVRASTPVADPAPVAPAVVRYKDVVVKAQLSSPAMDQAFAEEGSLTYNFSLDDTNKSQIVAPVLVHTVGRSLPVAEAAVSTADVTLALAVDPQGIPQDITIVHSGGTEAIDRGTVNAVRDYRFKAATFHNTPVVSHLIIEVKIKK